MCYDEPAKKRLASANRKFFNAAKKLLPGFEFKVHFNPGGVAVWGEVYAHIYRDGQPVVEAYNTNFGMLTRQWDGRNSGQNNYVLGMDQFVELVKRLAATPFRRF
jgi:hypothetical protein